MMRPTTATATTCTELALRLLVLLAGVSAVLGGTTLIPGDLHLVGWVTDNPDAFAFVTWVDLEQGTEILFTDKGWCGDGFMSGESVVTYTAPEYVDAGSVMSFVNGSPDQSSNGFSATSTFYSYYGDQMIVFQGTVENPTPIYALDSSGYGWWTGDCAEIDSEQTALPTGLTDGYSAVAHAHKDNFWYRKWYSTSGTLSTLKEWMVNPTRFWKTNTDRTGFAVPEKFTILQGVMGTNNLVEYIPGNAPCVIVSGHDGDVYPDNIIDRTHGCVENNQCVWEKSCLPKASSQCGTSFYNDDNTQDMARRAADKFEESTGLRCHLVVNRLGRRKLDPNREIDAAAQGDPIAMTTYNEFHGFIEQASDDMENGQCGRGLVLDFHGHIHEEARIELGYRLQPGDLRTWSDGELDNYAWDSSIFHMPTWNTNDPDYKFSDIIRGQYSLGELFERPTNLNSSGYEAVPSPTVPYAAQGEGYFNGGYITDLYGSQHGGTIDAVQIEFPSYLRTQEYGQQEDMLHSFGFVVLPEYLEKQYLFTPLGGCADPQTMPPTLKPTTGPTRPPTLSPTLEPNHPPTLSPTSKPTTPPTLSPTLEPNHPPTLSPTSRPTRPPTLSPTSKPTTPPTLGSNEEMEQLRAELAAKQTELDACYANHADTAALNSELEATKLQLSEKSTELDTAKAQLAAADETMLELDACKAKLDDWMAWSEQHPDT